MTVFCPDSIAERSMSLCASVDLYCERTSWMLDAELVNAFSNLAFPIAATCAFFYWQRERSTGNIGLILTLIVLMVVVGVGSAIFHTIATAWAQWADVIPILAFMLVYLWLILTRFFDWSGVMALVGLAAFLALTVFIEASVPTSILWGGAMYLPALAVMLVLGVSLLDRWPLAGRKMLGATGVFAGSLLLRSLDMPLCDAIPVGTHFLWHILNGVLMFLLVRLVIRHAPKRALPSLEEY